MIKIRNIVNLFNTADENKSLLRLDAKLIKVMNQIDANYPISFKLPRLVLEKDESPRISLKSLKIETGTFIENHSVDFYAEQLLKNSKQLYPNNPLLKKLHGLLVRKLGVEDF